MESQPANNSQTPEKSASRLDFLDVARGIATLLVLFEHAVGRFIPNYEEWSKLHGSMGRMGVVLFLLISGFIIPVSLEKCGSNGRFWCRRIARLIPAYWFAIALAFCYAVWHPNTLAIKQAEYGKWLLNLTMLQGFFRVEHAWGVFWTLQLELVIYLGCSVLFACRLMKHWTGIIWFYLIAYALAGLLKPILTGKPFGIAGNGFLYFTPLMGVVAQRYVSGEFSRSKTYLLFGIQIASLALVWFVSHLYDPIRMNSQCLEEFLLLWGGAYFMLLLLVELRHFMMPAIACWFGRISYSVYLFHPFVLICISDLKLPMEWHLLLFIVGTLILSQITYWLIELPGIQLGRRLETRWFGPKPKID